MGMGRRAGLAERVLSGRDAPSGQVRQLLGDFEPIFSERLELQVRA